jgi:general secretion pathway protein D
LKEGETSIMAGLIQRTDSKTLNGWPGLAKIPIMRYLFSEDMSQVQDSEVLIVMTPRIVRLPDWTPANMRAIFSGSETYPTVKREMDLKAPAANPAPTIAPPPAQAPVQNPAPMTQQPAGPGAMNGPGVVGGPGPGNTGSGPPVTQTVGPKMRFEPSTVNLTPGQTVTLGIVVENVTDLYSVPMLLQYNPAIISIEEVRHGGFLSGGTQEIAIVQRVDKEHGQAIISATRQPNTPGVNGTGTLLGVVVKALAPGTSNLSIVQVNAKDSQQKPIPLITGEATLHVQ